MKYDRSKTGDSGNYNLIMNIILVCLAFCSEPSAFSPHMYVLDIRGVIFIYQHIELQARFKVYLYYARDDCTDRQ